MTPRTDQGAGTDVRPRHIRPADAPAAADHPAVRHKWAVIVGISKYRNQPTWNLQYADRDAYELAKLIRTPSGGGFDHVHDLINGKATTKNIYKALRGFLQQPARDDLVLIYFACHGVQDPNRPANLYLLTHDADPNDIPGTALPMREIDASLRDNLHAERVIIIADTCHSAAIAQGGRSVNSADAINRYLQQVGEAKGGTALLTSSEANETSHEGQEWGGGHGVFTHFLLEGMRGNADRDEDGVVSVGELFEYVRDQVMQATENGQHPAIGTTQFDRKLPVSVPGGDLAALHIELAEELYSLGWWLDDRRFFRSAQRHVGEAERVSPRLGPATARLEGLRGRIHEALDGDRQATKAFAKALQVDATAADALYLGVAEAKLGNHSGAAAAFGKFLEMEPHSVDAGWIREYMTWLQHVQKSTRRAILIGINVYANEQIPRLEGPVADVELMTAVLVDKFGFEPENVKALTDSAATRQAIIDELQALGRVTSPGDTVVVHFSGHSMHGSSEAYLLVHDAAAESGNWRGRDVKGAVSASELHDWINAIPTRHTTLILDTHPNVNFLALARENANYALLLATETGLSFESRVERNGSWQYAGAFTDALVRQLSGVDPRTATYDDIIYPVVRAVRSQFAGQVPCFVGIRARHLFGDADEYLSAIQFSRRHNYRDLTDDDIHQRYLRARETVVSPFPAMHASFGRAFLAHADYRAAIAPLRTACEQRKGPDPATTLALGVAQACTEDYRGAVKSFQAYRRARPRPTVDELLGELERHVQTAAHGRKYALLVGISEYANVSGALRATDDVAAVKEVLCTKYGFDDGDVTVLIDREATAQAIKESLTRLAETAHGDAALFYFAGYGSTTEGDVPTIVSHDGREAGVFDIELRELSAMAGPETRLVTIIDAGWNPPADEKTPSRSIKPDERPRPATRGLIAGRDLKDGGLQIGRLSLYASAMPGNDDAPGGEFGVDESIGDTGSPSACQPKGKLSWALVKALWAAVPGKATYSDVIRGAKTTMAELADDRVSFASAAPVVIGGPLDVPLFSKLADPAGLVRSWEKLEQRAFDRLIELLQRVIERRNGEYPECHVDLGIAYAVTGQHEKSVAALETALRQKDQDPDACYWLGRTLFESRGDLFSAVSRLREATELAPDNARAMYYLGQAIRLLVDQEMLSEAARALGGYLDAGAPLGDHDAVQAFVIERTTPATS